MCILEFCTGFVTYTVRIPSCSRKLDSHHHHIPEKVTRSVLQKFQQSTFTIETYSTRLTKTTVLISLQNTFTVKCQVSVGQRSHRSRQETHSWFRLPVSYHPVINV